MRRALFLDRDGVINHDSGYMHRVADCRFIDGIFDLARDFAGRGFVLVVATNQAGIGRGLFTEQDFSTLMDWMKAEFAARGAPIAAVYHCPHHPTAGIGPYRCDSPWRKPRPGMLLQAAADLELDLGSSWCIGDRMSDIEAGRAAGVGTLVLLDEGSETTAWRGQHWTVPNLAAVHALLAPTGAPAGRTQ